jgi:hypothetical protein
MKIFLMFFVAGVSAHAQNWDCVRVRVQPSSICENLKTTIDHSLCGQRPVTKNSRLECKNEFYAEFLFEADDQVYRASLTKSANGVWSAGQPVAEPKEKPPVVAPVEIKSEPTKANYKFWTEFRARAESNKETNLTNNQSPSYLRLRPGLEWQAQPKLSLLAEAQATRIWGQEDYVPSSSTSNARSKNRENEFTLHQGYLKYLPFENLDFRVGRMSLNYGDALLIGDSDWSNVGRSFDTLSGRWTNKWGWLEAFGSKIVDRSISSDTPGDEDLYGLYLHTECREGNSNLDAYVFDYQDSTNVDAAGNAITSRMYEVWSYGARVSSQHDSLSYRLEYTKQSSSVSANQVDGEVGLANLWKHKISAGYFDADEEFNQLFPSAHKWLGYANVLSRRNIQGQFVRITGNRFENLTFETTYYWFNRHSETKAAFAYDGTALATSSRAKDIGQELDIEARYDLEKELQLLLGYADFFPGSYVKDQYSNIDPVRWYVQVTAKF